LNTKKSEAKMVKNFKKKFGDQYNTMIAIGDWEQKKQIKYKEPTKGKGMRTLFRKVGYNVFLIDEYNTSCKCAITGDPMEKFLKRVRPKDKILNKENPKERLCHGLLRSKNEKNNNNRTIIMNRDYNGSLNIREKALCFLFKLKLPEYLKRTKIMDEQTTSSPHITPIKLGT